MASGLSRAFLATCVTLILPFVTASSEAPPQADFVNQLSPHISGSHRHDPSLLAAAVTFSPSQEARAVENAWHRIVRRAKRWMRKAHPSGGGLEEAPDHLEGGAGDEDEPPLDPAPHGDIHDFNDYSRRRLLRVDRDARRGLKRLLPLAGDGSEESLNGATTATHHAAEAMSTVDFAASLILHRRSSEADGQSVPSVDDDTKAQVRELLTARKERAVERHYGALLHFIISVFLGEQQRPTNTQAREEASPITGNIDDVVDRAVKAFLREHSRGGDSDTFPTGELFDSDHSLSFQSELHRQRLNDHHLGNTQEQNDEL